MEPNSDNEQVLFVRVWAERDVFHLARESALTEASTLRAYGNEIESSTGGVARNGKK